MREITKVCQRCSQVFKVISKRAARKVCDDCKEEQAEAWELNRWRPPLVFVPFETLTKIIDNGYVASRKRNGKPIFRPSTHLYIE